MLVFGFLLWQEYGILHKRQIWKAEILFCVWNSFAINWCEKTCSFYDTDCCSSVYIMFATNWLFYTSVSTLFTKRFLWYLRVQRTNLAVVKYIWSLSCSQHLNGVFSALEKLCFFSKWKICARFHKSRELLAARILNCCIDVDPYNFWHSMPLSYFSNLAWLSFDWVIKYFLHVLRCSWLETVRLCVAFLCLKTFGSLPVMNVWQSKC